MARASSFFALAWPICFDDVLAARARLAPYLSPTPLRSYAVLDDELAGPRALVKHENHLPTNAFKARNALAFMTALSPAQRAAGVVAATRGNHGAGLAYAGAQLGVPVVICVPHGNNPEKNAAIRGHGAELIEAGADYDESVEVARMLESDGALDAIELTGGSSLENPMYLFRGEAPIHEMAAAMRQPMRLGFKFLGRRFLPSYPFEEAYFLPYARQFRAALAMPLILLGGINGRDTIERAMEEGFGYVAMGRALLREPDLVNRMQSGSEREGLCIHCNKCMPTIYTGTHCVLVPPEER